MSDRDRRDRLSAASTLLVARVVYAVNWYNIGAILPLVGTRFDASTADLGIVLGAFLLGAGVFQIPAGLAALRWGNRSVSIFALVLMGAFSFVSAFSPSWPVLAATRFGAGAGAAFFFAPALGLVTSYFPPGSRGPVIGLYNSGFSIGSAIGLLGGAAVGVAFGWSAALWTGGAALLVMAVVAPFGLPRIAPTGRPPAIRQLVDAAIPIFRSRSLWALALGTSGLWAALYLAAQYFVKFAQVTHPGWTLAVAAVVPTVMILLEVPGGPIGGWLGERRSEMREVILVWGVAAGVAIFLIPFLPFLGLFALFGFLGFADGVIFAVLYLLPSYLPESRGPNLALGLGVVNSIQIFFGSALTIAFGFLAGDFGYDVAWAFAGAVALGLLPLLLWVSGRRGTAVTGAVPGPVSGRSIRAPNRPA